MFTIIKYIFRITSPDNGNSDFAASIYRILGKGLLPTFWPESTSGLWRGVGVRGLGLAFWGYIYIYIYILQKNNIYIYIYIYLLLIFKNGREIGRLSSKFRRLNRGPRRHWAGLPPAWMRGLGGPQDNPNVHIWPLGYLPGTILGSLGVPLGPVGSLRLPVASSGTPSGLDCLWFPVWGMVCLCVCWFVHLYVKPLASLRTTSDQRSRISGTVARKPKASGQ